MNYKNIILFFFVFLSQLPLKPAGQRSKAGSSDAPSCSTGSGCAAPVHADHVDFSGLSEEEQINAALAESLGLPYTPRKPLVCKPPALDTTCFGDLEAAKSFSKQAIAAEMSRLKRLTAVLKVKTKRTKQTDDDAEMPRLEILTAGLQFETNRTEQTDDDAEIAAIALSLEEQPQGIHKPRATRPSAVSASHGFSDLRFSVDAPRAADRRAPQQAPNQVRSPSNFTPLQREQLTVGATKTPELTLLKAAHNGNLEEVMQALAKAPLDTKDFPSERTALMLAASQEHIHVVSALLQLYGRNLYEQTEMGMNLATAIKLTGADINAQDNKGNTALMHAVMNNRPRIVTMLLATGSTIMPLRDLMVPNFEGDTPLSRATACGHKEIQWILQEQIEAAASGTDHRRK